MQDTSRFTDLIKSYEDLPLTQKREETYLEISGYPYLENVASNILEFFFDPAREHNLGSTFLEALLTAVNQPWSTRDLQEVEVEREVVTKAGNRLDLVITTNSFVVGIENKLFAVVRNDLFDYQKHITEQANKPNKNDGNQLHPILILFTLYPQIESPGIFRLLTYEQFFTALYLKLGSAILDTNFHYLPFLIDFINTIRNLKEDNQMENDAFHDWIGEHKNEVEALLQSVREYRQKLKGRIKALNSLIDISGFGNAGIKCTQWYWDPPSGEIKRVLVYDVKIPPDINLAIDTILDPKGWSIYVFTRDYSNSKKHHDFMDWLDQHGISYSTINENSKRFLYGNIMEYSTSEIVVAELLTSLLSQILVGIENDKRTN